MGSPLASGTVPNSDAVLSDVTGAGVAEASAHASGSVAVPPAVPVVAADVASGGLTVDGLAVQEPSPTATMPARTSRVRIDEVANVRYVAAEKVGYSRPGAAHEPCPVTAAAAAAVE